MNTIKSKTEQVKDIKQKFSDADYALSKALSQYKKVLEEVYNEVKPIYDSGHRCREFYDDVCRQMKKHDLFVLVDSQGREVYPV
jgi:hypothetical protein